MAFTMKAATRNEIVGNAGSRGVTMARERSKFCVQNPSSPFYFRTRERAKPQLKIKVSEDSGEA